MSTCFNLSFDSPRFCSSACAFRHSHGIISAMTNKKTLKQLANTFSSYPPPSVEINVVHHQDISLQPTSKPGLDVLAMLQRQIDATSSAINTITKRQRILEQAMTRCEGLMAVAVTMTNGNDGVRKSKTKGARSGTDDRPCGWERRLIWDDVDVCSWDGGTGGEEGCSLPRRRCDRHQGRVREYAERKRLIWIQVAEDHDRIA